MCCGEGAREENVFLLGLRCGAPSELQAKDSEGEQSESDGSGDPARLEPLIAEVCHPLVGPRKLLGKVACRFERLPSGQEVVGRKRVDSFLFQSDMFLGGDRDREEIPADCGEGGDGPGGEHAEEAECEGDACRRRGSCAGWGFGLGGNCRGSKAELAEFWNGGHLSTTRTGEGAPRGRCRDGKIVSVRASDQVHSVDFEAGPREWVD